ncbi:hypothetical protein PSSHI_47970 [Photobacterium sp. R1]
MYEIVPGFVFATIAIIVVSKMTGGAPSELHAQFDTYEKNLREFD